MARMQFNTVEAGPSRSLRCSGKLLDQLPYIFLIGYLVLHFRAFFRIGLNKSSHFVGRQGGAHLVWRISGNGGHQHRTPGCNVTDSNFPRVLQLHRRPTTVLFNALRERAQTRQEFVSGDGNLIGVTGAGRPRYGSDTHNQHTGTALGPRLIVGLNALTTMTIFLRQVRTHRRHNDAVTQLQLTDSTRGQQLFKTHQRLPLRIGEYTRGTHPTTAKGQSANGKLNQLACFDHPIVKVPMPRGKLRGQALRQIK